MSVLWAQITTGTNELRAEHGYYLYRYLYLYSLLCLLFHVIKRLKSLQLLTLFLCINICWWRGQLWKISAALMYMLPFHSIAFLKHYFTTWKAPSSFFLLVMTSTITVYFHNLSWKSTKKLSFVVIKKWSWDQTYCMAHLMLCGSIKWMDDCNSLMWQGLSRNKLNVFFYIPLGWMVYWNLLSQENVELKKLKMCIFRLKSNVVFLQYRKCWLFVLLFFLFFFYFTFGPKLTCVCSDHNISFFCIL